MNKEEAWTCYPHVIPASHIRGFSRGVRNERTPGRILRLSVNEYVPKVPPEENTDPVTLIFHHGVGFTKESYEVLFRWIFKSSKNIRSIWSYDVAWHGKSFVLNEEVIGDIPHYHDDARDVLQIINHFQEKMPAPIVGVGHSMGSSVLMMASLMHPRLFSGLVFFDPGYATGYASGLPLKNHRALLMARRRDRWPSKEVARSSFLKSPYFQAFDPEVFELVMKHDLREVTGPDGTYVTSITPKAQEIGSMLRPIPPNSVKEYSGHSATGNSIGSELVMPGFHLYETVDLQRRMKEIVPSVHIIWGATSDVYAMPGYAQFAHDTIGTDRGVYAHSTQRRVTREAVEGAGHTLPLEKPKVCGEAVVRWLEQELPQWKREYELDRGSDIFWTTDPNPEWMKKISRM